MQQIRVIMGVVSIITSTLQVMKRRPRSYDGPEICDRQNWSINPSVTFKPVP